MALSGYHLRTSSTTSAGRADEGRPTRSDSAWSGFIQWRPSASRPTGSTSSVWATNCGDQGTDETGAPMVSRSLSTRGLLLGATALDRPPDGPDLGGGDLLMVLAPAVDLDGGDDLRLRAAGAPPAAAGDLHLHGRRAYLVRRRMARM